MIISTSSLCSQWELDFINQSMSYGGFPESSILVGLSLKQI